MNVQPQLVVTLLATLNLATQLQLLAGEISQSAGVCSYPTAALAVVAAVGAVCSAVVTAVGAAAAAV